MQPKLPLTFQDKVTHKATKISILTSHSERIKRTSNDVDEEKKMKYERIHLFEFKFT